MKKKGILKEMFEGLVDLFSTVFLWMLIWFGSVLALFDYGEDLLGIFLIVAGIAWVYRDIRNTYWRKKK